MKKVYLNSGEVVVKATTLRTLRRKALAHDATLMAVQDQNLVQARILAKGQSKTEYEYGWLDSHKTLAEGITSYAAELLADSPDLEEDVDPQQTRYASAADRVASDGLPF